MNSTSASHDTCSPLPSFIPASSVVSDSALQSPHHFILFLLGMALWNFSCKWRTQECKIALAKTQKIKDLKAAISDKLGLEASSLKLLLKGSSTHLDSTRLCDISGLSSPVSVTILSASLTTVSVTDIEKKKYDEEKQIIQQVLEQASSRPFAATSTLSPSIIAHQNLQEPDVPVRAVNRPTGHVELQLPIFSGALIPFGNAPSEFSNQIFLPSNVLQELTQQEVPFPIVLEASRTDINGDLRKTHLIPAEYHPRLSAAYAPYHVLQDLGAFEPNRLIPTSSSSMDVDVDPNISTTNSSSSAPTPFAMTGEGVLVKFKTVQLPLGTSATLQPLEFGWLLAIPEEQQKAVLETHLRRYLCISLNDTIKIEHQNQSFSFKVVALEPAAGVSLVSTDLVVDILTPVDSPQHSDLTQKLHITSRAPTDASVQEHKEVLNLKKGDFRFFSFDFPDPNLALLLEAESLNGFPPTIYVSSRHQYPTASEHAWTSDDLSEYSEKHIKTLQQTGRRRILLSQDDPKFTTGHFYVGISATMADASFTFRAAVGAKADLALGFSGGLTSGSLRSSDSNPPPNSSQCNHCFRWIPSATMALHQLQCARLNWVCPSCRFVCPISDKDKHMSIAHAIIKCECGFEAEGDLVALHRQYECHLRPFVCPYCNLSMPHTQRASHMNSCGSRTSKCHTCGVWVKNFELPAHLATAHPELSQQDQTETTGSDLR